MDADRSIQLRSLSEAEAAAPAPSVMVSSIPKSGSVFLQSTVADTLGLEKFAVSNQYFPEDQLRLEEILAFAEGGKIAVAHFDPSACNLQLLDAFVPKWIVHFRDPRSVLLSWTHHLARLWANGWPERSFRVTPRPPEEYYDGSLNDQVEWQIEHFLPGVIAWMQAWLSVADANPGRIMVTEFQAMRGREAEFVEDVGAFLNLGFTAADVVVPDKTMGASHFRTGTTDEWRTVFTPAQIRAASQAIPAALAERFDWRLD